jgi:hypothetical protein
VVKQRYTSTFKPPTPPALPPSFPGSGIYGKPPAPTIFNPFTDRAIQPSPIGYQVDIVDDGCNLGVQVSPSFLFVRLPPVQLVYRNSYCNKPREIKPPNTPPITNDTQIYEYPPACEYPNLAVSTVTLDQRYIDGEGSDLTGFNYFFNQVNVANVENPVDFGEDGIGAIVTLLLTSKINYQTSQDDPTKVDQVNEFSFSYHIHENAGTDNRNNYQGYQLVTVDRRNRPNDAYLWIYRLFAPPFVGFGGTEVGSVVLTVAGVIEYFPNRQSRKTSFNYYQYGERNDLFRTRQVNISLPTPVRTFKVYPVEQVSGGWNHFSSRLEFRNSQVDNFLLCNLSPILPPPPPDMSCNCCPNIQQNDELLRLILKRIGTPVGVEIFDEDLEREGSQKAIKTPDTLFKASKLGVERTEISNRLIGIENYPVKVPETMIEPHKEGIFENIFGFFEGEKQREIKSVTEMIAWMAEQDSAVLGQFHQVIEFEQDFDGDGNIQKEQVVLPNVAETLKEVILLLVQLANNEGTKVHALAKILIEISNIKANLFKTMNTVVDIQDYLDYPTMTKTVEVPLPVDLTLDKDTKDFQDFFKESTGKTTFEDWDGTNSLHDNMLDLMQMATMLRAMLYQRTNQE